MECSVYRRSMARCRRVLVIKVAKRRGRRGLRREETVEQTIDFEVFVDIRSKDFCVVDDKWTILTLCPAFTIR